MTRQIATASLLLAGAFAAVVWVAGAGHAAHGVDAVIVVDLKAIGNFDLPDRATDADIPAKFRGLDGKRVQAEGYALQPNTAAGGVMQFRFVYNFTGDYWGRRKVQDRVVVAVPHGTPADVPDPYTMVRVSGVLHVGIKRDARGGVESVYRMDAVRVEPVADRGK